LVDANVLTPKFEAIAKRCLEQVAAGATTYKEPSDRGFMYQHGFQDLDGHLWEIFFMDESAIGQTT
jgi:uncharacterized protein